jgi:Spy/CpxP family protein refolding chaperone
MNKLMISLALAAASLCAHAQQPGPANQTSPGPEVGRARGGKHFMDRIAATNKDILKQLHLAVDQQKKVDDLVASTKSKFQALTADLKARNADKDAAKAEVRNLMKDYSKSLSAILTKEQKKQYMTLIKAAREKAKAARDGATKPNG